MMQWTKTQSWDDYKCGFTTRLTFPVSISYFKKVGQIGPMRKVFELPRKHFEVRRGYGI